MLVTAKEFKNVFAEQLKKAKNFEGVYDVEIVVNYVIDMFAEDVYVDVEIYRDGEFYDTWNFDLFESQGKTYNASKEVAKHFEKYTTAEVTWKKQVYR